MQFRCLFETYNVREGARRASRAPSGIHVIFHLWPKSDLAVLTGLADRIILNAKVLRYWN